MAVVKDWVAEAAQQIYAVVHPNKHYVSTEARHDEEHYIASIIDKHSPFQRDVAYMPVPRCETCQFMRESPNIKPHCTYLNMQTIPKFGCVAWRSRI